jgi:hypothetical protein
MHTARRHFHNRGAAATFALLKKTQGFNTGALRMPIRGKTDWIIFWSTGYINAARARRA